MIFTHRALVSQAENVVQVEPRIQLAIGCSGAGGSLGEADVVFGQKLTQHCSCLFQRSRFG